MRYMDVDAVDFQVVRVNVGRASGVIHGDTHFGFSPRMDTTDGMEHRTSSLATFCFENHASALHVPPL
jgi:hypothetical protein